MDSNLSDISIVSPSVAAAAVRDREIAAARMNGGRWASPSTIGGRLQNGNLSPYTLNALNSMQSRPLTRDSFANSPYQRVGGSTDHTDVEDAGAQSDVESTTSTSKLLEGLRSNGNPNPNPLGSTFTTGLLQDAPDRPNPYSELLAKYKNRNQRTNDSDSVLTEDFVSKFKQIAVTPDASRRLPADLPNRSLLNDPAKRLNPSTFDSSTLPRAASRTTTASPIMFNRNSLAPQAAAASRVNPFKAKPMDSPVISGSANPQHTLVSSANANGSGSGSGIEFGLGGRSSPMRNPTMERLQTKLGELESLQKQVRGLREEKQRIVDELENMNRILKQQQLEVLRVAAKIKADSPKGELISLQQKRDATLTEVESLNNELAQRERKLDELEDAACKQLDEIRQFESHGVTKQEIDALVAKRNELMELVSQLERRESEKVAVQKQLERTQHDRVKDQRIFNEQFVQLTEQLEQVVRQNEALQTEVDHLRNEAGGLKRDRDSFLESAATQFKQRLQREVAEVQKQSTNEIASLKNQLFESNEKLKQLMRELERKTSALQSAQAEAERLMEQVGQNKPSGSNEMNIYYDNLQRQNDESLRNLHYTMMEEQQMALRNQEAQFASEIEQFRQALIEKDKECLVLRDKLRHVESTYEQLSSRMSRENLRHSAAQTGGYEELIKEAVDAEKRRWKDEQDRAQNELFNVKFEREKTMKNLSDELQRANWKLEEREDELRRVKDELEKEQEQRSLLASEKSRELAKVKEECRVTLQNEIEKLRSEAVHEMRGEATKYKEQLGDIQKQLDERLRKEGDQVKTLANFLRPVLNEINKDYGAIAQILELEPSDLEFARINQNGNDSVGELFRATLGIVRDAFSYSRKALEAYNKDVTALKQLLKRNEEIKTDELERLRARLNAESERRLGELRDRLNRNHADEIQKISLSPSANAATFGDLQTKWKQDAATKIAAELQTEFRSELERRTGELQQSIRLRDAQLRQLRDEKAALEQRANGSSQKVASDETAVKTITQLHAQLKQLRDENLELRKTASQARRASPSQANLYEESDAGSVSKGVTFARRPGSPSKPSLTLDRNSSERRSDGSANHVRFSPMMTVGGNSVASSTEGTSSVGFNRSAPLFSSLSGGTHAPSQAQAQAQAQSALSRTTPFKSSLSFSSAPLGSGASMFNLNTIGNGQANGYNGRETTGTAAAYANEPSDTAEDLQAQVYEAAKNKTLRQIDFAYSNLKTKLQKQPPTFRSIGGALTNSSFGSSAAISGGGNSFSQLQSQARASPLGTGTATSTGIGTGSLGLGLGRSFGRITPKSSDTLNKKFIETAM